MNANEIAVAPIARRLYILVVGAMLALALSLAATLLHAQTPAFTPRDESPEEYPAGTGRDETFYSCTACHGFKIVAQQGLNRRQWEESLDLMVAKHKMNPLDGDDRKIVLDYLETTYPPRGKGGREAAPNPFLKR